MDIVVACQSPLTQTCTASYTCARRRQSSRPVPSLQSGQVPWRSAGLQGSLCRQTAGSAAHTAALITASQEAPGQDLQTAATAPCPASDTGMRGQILPCSCTCHPRPPLLAGRPQACASQPCQPLQHMTRLTPPPRLAALTQQPRSKAPGQLRPRLQPAPQHLPRLYSKPRIPLVGSSIPPAAPPPGTSSACTACKPPGCSPASPRPAPSSPASNCKRPFRLQPHSSSRPTALVPLLLGPQHLRLHWTPWSTDPGAGLLMADLTRALQRLSLGTTSLPARCSRTALQPLSRPVQNPTSGQCLESTQTAGTKTFQQATARGPSDRHQQGRSRPALRRSKPCSRSGHPQSIVACSLGQSLTPHDRMSPRQAALNPRQLSSGSTHPGSGSSMGLVGRASCTCTPPWSICGSQHRSSGMAPASCSHTPAWRP